MCKDPLVFTWQFGNRTVTCQVQKLPGYVAHVYVLGCHQRSMHASGMMLLSKFLQKNKWPSFPSLFMDMCKLHSLFIEGFLALYIFGEITWLVVGELLKVDVLSYLSNFVTFHQIHISPQFKNKLFPAIISL